MKVTQTLVLNEEKKHSVRYDMDPALQPHDQVYLTSIYITKKAFINSSGWPRQITITIEAS
jgi:hypothetical protein